ncbi:hypothetical protein OMAG_001822 [Candidatus Omnitrophus magneticus]|uniref:Uncharacterized protein n=1 Tax=Candidatus Omnitrophus magneticus TaxID=1609969 RepID=A0A0F0CQR8_9BACT|nr:hypothetical protein OMAG_001822 [Candidatus Omnitrophus magneticus]
MIKHAWQGNGKKLVIHIQDAHCNYFAQKQIFELLNYLNSKYNINIVNLEGGAKHYDLSLFTGINDYTIKEKVSVYFMKTGKLNGAEFAGIMNPENLFLWGVEEPAFYIENLKIYRDSLLYKETALRLLGCLSNILNPLKQHIFSRQLLLIDNNYDAYKNGSLEFKEYLTFLIHLSQEHKINISDLTNILLLKQTLLEEEKINFKKADNEKEALIKKFKKILSTKEFTEIIAKSLTFKEKQISQNAFYEYLTKKAEASLINNNEFSELKKYSNYNALYEQVDKSEITVELASLETRLRQILYKNDDEKTLAELSKTLTLTKNMFNLSMVNLDYDYYKKNTANFSVNNYTAFIKKHADKYGINTALPKDIEMLDTFREKISKFFDLSFKRDDAFIQNIKFSKNMDTEISVIITGGFHTENLLTILKEKDISYISIIPLFISPEGYNSPYFSLLSGGMNIFETMLNETLYALQVPSSLTSLATKIAEMEGAEGITKQEIFRMGALLSEWMFRNETKGAQALQMSDGTYIIFEIKNNEPSVRISPIITKDINLVNSAAKYALTKEGFKAIASEIIQDRYIRVNEKTYLLADNILIKKLAAILNNLPETNEKNILTNTLETLLNKKSYENETGAIEEPIGYSGVIIIENENFTPHAGQALYLNPASDEFTALHELLAGTFNGNPRLNLDSHGLAEQIELAIKNNDTATITNLLTGAERHMLETIDADGKVTREEKTLFEMTRAERQKLEHRDFAAGDIHQIFLWGLGATRFLGQGTVSTVRLLGLNKFADILGKDIGLENIKNVIHESKTQKEFINNFLDCLKKLEQQINAKFSDNFLNNLKETLQTTYQILPETKRNNLKLSLIKSIAYFSRIFDIKQNPSNLTHLETTLESILSRLSKLSSYEKLDTMFGSAENVSDILGWTILLSDATQNNQIKNYKKFAFWVNKILSDKNLYPAMDIFKDTRLLLNNKMPLEDFIQKFMLNDEYTKKLKKQNVRPEGISIVAQIAKEGEITLPDTVSFANTENTRVPANDETEETNLFTGMGIDSNDNILLGEADGQTFFLNTKTGIITTRDNNTTSIYLINGEKVIMKNLDGDLSTLEDTSIKNPESILLSQTYTNTNILLLEISAIKNNALKHAALKTWIDYRKSTGATEEKPELAKEYTELLSETPPSIQPATISEETITKINTLLRDNKLPEATKFTLIASGQEYITYTAQLGKQQILIKVGSKTVKPIALNPAEKEITKEEQEIKTLLNKIFITNPEYSTRTITEYNNLKERFTNMNIANEYHDFRHTMDDVRLVLQGLIAMRKYQSYTEKDALKVILAALFHDFAYGDAKTQTHDHVEKSFLLAGQLLVDIPSFTNQDVDDILAMISATSITPLQFESQPLVKSYREGISKGDYVKEPSLKEMTNILLTADLAGAATTNRYFSNLIQLYREIAESKNSDMFGSALQLVSGTFGFQEFFAKGQVLADAYGITSEETDNFKKMQDRSQKTWEKIQEKQLFTQKQLDTFSTHMETSKKIAAAYNNLKQGKPADTEIAKIKDSFADFIGTKMDETKITDFTKMITMLELLNRMVKGDIKPYDKSNLETLKQDPAFITDASIALLYGAAIGLWNFTEEEVNALFDTMDTLYQRKKTAGTIDYGFNKYITAIRAWKDSYSERLLVARQEEILSQIKIHKKNENALNQQLSEWKKVANAGRIGKIYDKNGNEYTGPVEITDKDNTIQISNSNTGEIITEIEKARDSRGVITMPVETAKQKLKDAFGNFLKNSSILTTAEKTFLENRLIENLGLGNTNIKEITALTLKQGQKLYGTFGDTALYIDARLLDTSSPITFMSILHEEGERIFKDISMKELSGILGINADTFIIQNTGTPFDGQTLSTAWNTLIETGFIHTLLRGIGDKAMTGLEKLINKEGISVVDAMSPLELFNALNNGFIIRPATDNKLTTNEKILLLINRERRSDYGTRESQYKIEGEGLQGRINPALNYLFTMEIKNLSSDLKKNTLDRFILPATIEIEQKMRQAGNIVSKNLEKTGISSKALFFSSDTEIEQAILLAAKTMSTKENTNKLPLTLIVTLTDTQKKEAERIVKEKISPELIERFLIVTSGLTEQEAREGIINAAKFMAIGTHMLNYKRKRDDYKEIENPDAKPDLDKYGLSIINVMGQYGMLRDTDKLLQAKSPDEIINAIFARELNINVLDIWKNTQDAINSMMEVARSL